jgi:hypothetical protein
MSLVDLALLPIRVGLGVADAVLHAVAPVSPAPPSELVVIDGMPEGVPAAALRPERALAAPASWPFGEDFPRTCGTGRFAGGALFWTDFLYDDHGANGVPVGIPTGGLVPPLSGLSSSTAEQCRAGVPCGIGLDTYSCRCPKSWPPRWEPNPSVTGPMNWSRSCESRFIGCRPQRS